MKVQRHRLYSTCNHPWIKQFVPGSWAGHLPKQQQQRVRNAYKAKLWNTMTNAESFKVFSMITVWVVIHEYFSYRINEGWQSTPRSDITDVPTEASRSLPHPSTLLSRLLPDRQATGRCPGIPTSPPLINMCAPFPLHMGEALTLLVRIV